MTTRVLSPELTRAAEAYARARVTAVIERNREYPNGVSVDDYYRTQRAMRNEARAKALFEVAVAAEVRIAVIRDARAASGKGATNG